MLQKEQGILPMVVLAQGKPLSDDTVRPIKEFYHKGDISQVTPEAKHFVSVSDGGSRTCKQHRLLLLKLNELLTSLK